MYSGYFGLILISYLLYLFLTKMELFLIILFMLEAFSVILRQYYCIITSSFSVIDNYFFDIFTSYISSINLYSVAFSSIGNNFKCGFYSLLITGLRYRFNYWFILFHFLIFEQELILALLLDLSAVILVYFYIQLLYSYESYINQSLFNNI